MTNLNCSAPHWTANIWMGLSILICFLAQKKHILLPLSISISFNCSLAFCFAIFKTNNAFTWWSLKSTHWKTRIFWGEGCDFFLESLWLGSTVSLYSEHFKACRSFCFEPRVLIDSTHSILWACCAFGNVFLQCNSRYCHLLEKKMPIFIIVYWCREMLS